MKSVKICIFILLCILLAPILPCMAGNRFTAELMVQNESFGDVRFSADGSRIYFDRLLPYHEKRHIDQEQNQGRDLSSLWLADVATGRIEPIGNGAGDRTWFLGESPGGDYLAYGWLDEGVARLGLRDLRNGRDHRLLLPISMNLGCVLRCPMWVSDSELLVLSQEPEEQQFAIAYSGHLLRKRMKLSEQAWTGAMPSARVVGSGHYPTEGTSEHSMVLYRVDARTGETRKLDVLSSAWLAPVLAPGGGRIAYLEKKGRFDLAGVSGIDTTWMEDLSDLVILDVGRGRRVIPVCEGCSPDYGSLRWSPSGLRLFFTARYLDGTDIRHRAYVHDVESGQTQLMDLRDVALRFHREYGYFAQFSPVLWLDEEYLAIRTRNEQAGQFDDQQFRWFLINRKGEALRELTAGLERGRDNRAFENPVAVYRGSLLVMADDHLWRLPVKGEARRLTDTVGKVDSWCPALVVDKSPSACYAFLPKWVDMPLDEVALQHGRIALLPKRDGVRTGDVAFLDLETGSFQLLPRPDTDSEPLQFSPKTAAAVYWRKSDGDGDELRLVHADGSQHVLYRFNRHLRGVKKARAVMLTRRESGEDEDRYDWVLLPPDHRPGQRHPLLVWFYPDMRYGKQLREHDDLRDVSFVNLQVPASRGYAVLLASMKISDFGTPGGNPMREMHEQLIRAAENVVAHGYADPERWAVLGHSYGGYGANSIVTQTMRFKAAISVAGTANLTASYGVWRMRAPDYVPDGFGYAVWHEHGQGRMGGPPWQNPRRYIDNSPLFWAQNIETPMLIFAGDLDYPEQAEQMFTALHRQGKDAIFVRYWGEGHVYRSPANIVDFWDRIFDFLDEHLGPPDEEGRSGTQN
jgi:dipeptidyl aminopeptidase/acylaminoacyl peptidase